MNLCLRTNGRKKCAEIAEQSIIVLSTLLTHPNQEVFLSTVVQTSIVLFRLDRM